MKNTTQTPAQHTPTPWRITDQLLNIAGSGGRYVASVCDWSMRPSAYEAVNNALRQEADANAAFIVRACNAHAGLVEALGIAATTLETVYRERDPKNIAAKCAADRARAILATLEA